MDGSQDPNVSRKAWLSVLAKADAAAVATLWAKTGLEPAHTVLRAPEIGAVMVRGRAGAVGAPFNLGEMTVTRASIRLASGEVGHGYIQGRSKDHAHTAALV
ncbi:MAG: phosphonate C-P lyase system protein PhnG, partial [Pseudomonadota bacterium]